MLIILDKSSKIELDKNLLNKTIEFFLEETELPKFIVISENETDVFREDKISIGINELDSRNAARLLLLCSSQYIEDHNKDLNILAEHEIFKLISRNPSSIIRFSQFFKNTCSMLDEIVIEQKSAIESLRVAQNVAQTDPLGLINEDWSWVIKQSYEILAKSYPEQLEILFFLCQLPGGALDSDFDCIFGKKFPKWREFLGILMKQKEKILDDAKKRIKDLELDEETFWLITFKSISQIKQNHYLPYQIVYSYVNKAIISTEQRQDVCKLAITHLSHTARDIMRSLKYSEIKWLSLAKFTAAIDVGLWSDSDNFTDPRLYYKDYENLTSEPKVMFELHEYNFDQFLDIDVLQEIFST